MDNQSLQNNPQEKKLKNLPFWEIGLVEFGFVAVVLILLFGILNYFNILSISDAFPQQLSWLPRQKVKIIPPSQLFSRVPTPTILAGFQYDAKKAQEILSQYITQNLKSDIVSSNSVIGQFGNRFSSHFTVKDTPGSATLYYQQAGSAVSLMTIFIDVSSIKETTATPALANSLLTSYFLTFSSSITECATQGLSTHCESFTEASDGKRGFGINFVTESGKSSKSLYTCFVPRESKYFQEQPNCTSLRNKESRR